MTSLALLVPSVTGSLEAYIQAVNRFPILTQERRLRSPAVTVTMATLRRRGNSCSRICA